MLEKIGYKFSDDINELEKLKIIIFVLCLHNIIIQQ